MNILNFIDRINDLYGNEPVPKRFDTTQWLRPGFRGGQLVDHGPAGVRQGYAEKNLPPIKKKAPARLEFYEFIKKNPNIEFKTAQDLLKKANIDNLTIDMVNRTIQDLGLESITKKTPATNFEMYDSAAKEYNQLLDNAIKNSDGTKLPDSFASFLESKNLSKNTYHNWKLQGKVTLFKDMKDTKKQIVDDLIIDANKGLKFVEAQVIAKKSGFGSLGNMQSAFDGVSIYDRKKNALDVHGKKVTKAFDNFMSDMNKPVESFFNPGYKISKITGVNVGTVSKVLNSYQPYLDDSRFMSNLRNDGIQTKLAGKKLTLGQFYDHMQNRILVYEEAGREMAKMGTIEKRIVEDAWRHTQQGGTKFEWAKKPGLDKSGNLVRWGDAKFKYKGKGSSGKIWSVDTLNINASEAPEFKEYFKVSMERNKLLNEMVTHPVSGKEVKFGQLMKEVYNIVSGQSYCVMSHQLDHLDLLNDPLGLDPKKGLRILPARINSSAGQVKKNLNKYKYEIGKPETYIKYSPANSAQAFDKMGYNYTKDYNQLLNDEYNFAKKVFNKYQAAGWRWDPAGNRWTIKPGFEKSANAIKGNIIRKPMQIVAEVQAGNRNVLDIVEQHAGKETKAWKFFSELYASGRDGRKQLKSITSLTGINDYLRANKMKPICITESPKKCGTDLIKSEGGVEKYRSELEKRMANAKGDEKWFKAYNSPKMASVKNFFKGAGKKLWKFGKAGVIGELYYIPFGTAY